MSEGARWNVPGELGGEAAFQFGRGLVVVAFHPRRTVPGTVKDWMPAARKGRGRSYSNSSDPSRPGPVASG